MKAKQVEKLEARLKPCDISGWRFGRWRPVEIIRTTVDDDGNGPHPDPSKIKSCRGGGVPINAQIVQYADKETCFQEHWYDFIWNVEVRPVQQPELLQ